MLSKYFNEIKNRLLLILLSGGLSILTCYIYKETLLFLTLETFIKNYENTSNLYLISTTITEIFSSYLKLSYFISIQFTLIIFLYQIIIFLAPGLYQKEYNKLIKIMFIIIIILLINIILFHKLILPFFWNFFLSFQSSFQNKNINVYFEGKFNEYLNFYISSYITINITINLFLTQFIIIDLVKNKTKFIKNNRKIFFLLFAIVSTLITPPDIISQIILIILFSILFEITLIIIILKTNYVLIRQPIKT